MIRKPSRQSATRLTCGVLVAAASAFTVGVGLAGSAGAVATNAISGTTNSPVALGGTATVTGIANSNGTPTGLLEWYIASGPDAAAHSTPAYLTGSTGTTNGTSLSYTASSTTAGVDDVRVFEGPNANTSTATTGGDFNAANPYHDFNITVTAQPTSLSIAPASGSSSSTTAGVTQTYTVAAATNSGVAANAVLNIAATQTVPTGTTTSPITLAAAGATETGKGASGTTATDNIQVTTDGTGKATFTVTSSQAGTVNLTVSAASGTAPNVTSSLTVTGGLTGNDAVTSVTATPATTNAYTTTGSPTFTVVAKDSSGNPVAGATIDYVLTGGPDFTTVGGGVAHQFTGSTTPANGTLTGTITGLGTATAGTDNITFYVNHTNSGASSNLPDGTDPTAPVTVVYSTLPAGTTGTLSVAKTVLPVGTTAPVVYTATVTNGSGSPLSGVNVVFRTSSTSTALSAAHQNQSTTVTTGANGQAIFSITPDTTANGQFIRVHATIAGNEITDSPISVTYETPAAVSPFTVTPLHQSVAPGGQVTVKAKVADQFGNGIAGQVFTFAVSGRNSAVPTGTVTTDSTGTATFTYTDAGTFTIPDNITVTDTTSALGGPQTATVDFPAGGIAPATVNITAAPSTTTDFTVDGATTRPVTVHVVNQNGIALQNSAVTIAVSNGFVTDGTPFTTTPTTKTVTLNTDSSGNATAQVGSTVSGTQTVTVTAGSATATTTVHYVADDATTVTLAPATAKIVPGQDQKFTATAVDEFGNGVAGDDLNFVQSGPGNLSGNSSQFGITAADGTASVTLSLPANATVGGTGTVSVTDTNINPLIVGNTATASATYSVITAGPATVALAFGSTNVVHKAGHVTATVKNSDGTPSVGVTIHFTLTGATAVTGTASTGPNGVATFAYTPTASGAVSATAYADTNSNGTQDTDEPSGSATATISKAPKPSETPVITLQSHTKGWVHITIKTHPVNHVSRVNIFQVVGGKKVLKRQVRTNNAGVATFTFKGLKRGSKVTYTARSLNPNYIQHFAHSKTVRVKKKHDLTD